MYRKNATSNIHQFRLRNREGSETKFSVYPYFTNLFCLSIVQEMMLVKTRECYDTKKFARQTVLNHFNNQVIHTSHRY